MHSRKYIVEKQKLDEARRQYIDKKSNTAFFGTASCWLLIGYLAGAIGSLDLQLDSCEAQEGFWSIITCNLMKVKRLLGAAEVVIPATNLMLCLLISGVSVVAGVAAVQQCQRRFLVASWEAVACTGYAMATFGAVLLAVGADVFSQMGGPSKPLWITGQILACIAIGAIDTVYHTKYRYKEMRRQYQAAFLILVAVLTTPWHRVLRSNNPCF